MVVNSLLKLMILCLIQSRLVRVLHKVEYLVPMISNLLLMIWLWDPVLSLSYVKYVDDTTVLSVSKKLQDCADHLVRWTQINGMKINTNKTKELIICFSKKVSIEDIPHLSIRGDNIDRVTTFKLLGVVISVDLTWDSHVTYILQKVAKRMYYIT